MRIEIDTKHDTKEDLAHLATMLRALSGSSSSGSTVLDNRLERKLARKGIASSPASEAPAASGSLFNLFNDDPASPAAGSPASELTSPQPAPALPSSGAASGDMFSLFNSEPEQPAEPQASPSTFDILNSTPEKEEEEEEDKKPSSVKDLLDDDRIVPY